MTPRPDRAAPQPDAPDTEQSHGRASAPARRGIDRAHRRVILAASLGTVFEWYDFYLYGSLAALLSRQFFAGVNEITAFILALLAFAAGFAIRPLGAVVFGHLGDRVGRKQTFLVTIVIMGSATALVGLLPTYATIGVAAPVLLVALRLLQGLAIGGEYGGAATYVAEHAPPDRRGYYTGWIQTTATVGFILSLCVILSCRLALGPAFEIWGWRIPFLTSTVLLAISVYIRLQLEESPVFQEMRREGRLSAAPVAEAFGRWSNLRVILAALFGATAGQAVVGYVALIYMLLFLEQTLKLDSTTASLLVAGALALSTPLFVIFGSLSDRIGRKPVVLGGCLLTGLTLFPIFQGLTRTANPAIALAQEQQPIVVVADPQRCSFQFDPIGKARFTSSCDVAKSALTRAGVPYTNEAAAPGQLAVVRIGDTELPSFEGDTLDGAEFRARSAQFASGLGSALDAAGYPRGADPAQVRLLPLFALLLLVSVYGTLTYGPIAAWLVELFPARVRYTSLSVPYHLGNGWFGGFLPTVSFALIAYTGDIYQGLWYPVVVSLVTACIGALCLPETRGRPSID